MLDRTAEMLAASRRPVIVCGTDIVAPGLVDLAADAALLLPAAQKKAGLFYILPGANAFAAGLLAPSDGTTDRILEAVVDGGVKALVLVENDPFAVFPHRKLLERALSKTESLIVLDYLDTPLSRRAHVFLPTQTLFESGGVFINQEGRAQYSAAAFAGGTPDEQCRRATVNSERQTGQRVGAAYMMKSLHNIMAYNAYNIQKCR